jgi:hypothetical protein
MVAIVATVGSTLIHGIRIGLHYGAVVSGVGLRAGMAGVSLITACDGIINENSENENSPLISLVSAVISAVAGYFLGFNLCLYGIVLTASVIPFVMIPSFIQSPSLTPIALSIASIALAIIANGLCRAPLMPLPQLFPETWRV